MLNTPIRQRIIARRLKALFLGPQTLALLPAAMLGAYWYGGEGMLLIFSATMPAVVLLAGGFTNPLKVFRRDAATGLPAKDALIAHLETGLLEGSNAEQDLPTCIIVDIDSAAAIEAQFGEAASERVMATCAERLKTVLREADFLAALGIGRFGIAFASTPRTDLEALVQLAGRLQDVVGQPISLDGTRLLLTACIGFALPARVPDGTGRSLLDAAESALEEARKSGPGSIRAFSRGMRPRISVPDNMTKDVIRALEQGEIAPWFQPQVSTDTGEVTGVEALARWKHPDKGQIAPAVFMPAIAEAGLFERLGEVMLHDSLHALARWDAQSIGIPTVSVNFSPDELRNPRLFERVKWELDRQGLEPGRLVIEVLENVVSNSDDDTTTRNIAALSRLGCGIDLDDFGTGHASISNIRRFDVSRIKIDRSFISQVDHDRDQQNMVSAILTMAERLGLETLAEGVETHGEHAMLAQLGCGHVQGYSIARPMPTGDVADWINRYRAKLQSVPDVAGPQVPGRKSSERDRS